MTELGKHFLAEYYDCNYDSIDNLEIITETLLEAARCSGATVLQHNFHRFSPQGISGVVIIAESHISIHSWPEYNYAAVDLFSCSDFNHVKALQYIKNQFNADTCQVMRIQRGIMLEKQLSISHPVEDTRFTL